MSKERKLLQEAVEWMHELRYVWANSRDSGDYDLLDLIAHTNKIEQLLAQPEPVVTGVSNKEFIYYETLQEKVARMKQEWLENHITDELINGVFACAKEELANESEDYV